MLRNVSGWFKQPPALAPPIFAGLPLEVVVSFHDPNSCVSFQVFDNEKIDVLISLQTDISLKWVRKSSNGILKVKLETYYYNCR